ncbi:MAG: aminopeptidase [Bacilli bacterium]
MNNKLRKFAKLIVNVGVNVQKDQIMVINSPVECKEFTRLLAEEGYLAGSKYVMVRWNDDTINKTYFTYADLDVIKEVPNFVIEQFKYIVDNNAAVISITAPSPGLLKDIDPNKLQLNAKVTNEKVQFYRKHMMSNSSQWCVVAYPTEAWAEKVFPNVDEKSRTEKLLDAILEASRVTENNDPVAEWNKHMDTLARHNKMLNDYNFKTLNFKNSLGTDLEITLVEDHIWGGGGEHAKNGVYFAPNIPTEETFTMPHKFGANGKVVATKPLNYQGKLIEDFYLVFKDGKVVEYDAKKDKDALTNLLDLDEGSRHLGEVALISHDSPISNMNILFYNTLFDENASCHLALGNAYTMNIKNGNNLSDDELEERGYNKSMNHVDFMFGSKDMEIVGTTHDGKKVQIFSKGNFVF